MELKATGDDRCWLWQRGIVSFLGASRTERVIDQACRSQFFWRSKDSAAWDRAPRRYRGRIVIDGSLRRIVNKCAVCGWAVVQMDFDEGMTPWYGVGGIMPIALEVQRTIKRAEIGAL